MTNLTLFNEGKSMNNNHIKFVRMALFVLNVY